MKKVVLTIVILLIGITAFFYFSTPKETEANGLITVELVGRDGSIESVKSIDYDEGYTLFDVLDDNYELLCADAAYKPSTSCNKVTMNGRVVLGMDSVETNWTNSFIAIYVNDVYSVVGIDSIIINDNDVFRFEYTEVGGGSK